MALLSSAIITTQQVSLLEMLFSSFSKEFYIKDESLRGQIVRVRLYGFVKMNNGYETVVTGWDETYIEECRGFESFYSACKTELEKLKSE